MTASGHEQTGVLTAAAVRERTFSTTRFKPGYDEDEVDTFLDEIEHTLTVLHAELASLRDSVAAAPAQQPAEGPAETPSAGTSEMEEMLRRTLLLAQRTADQAVAEAREQADKDLTEARTEAQRLLSEARGRAQSVEVEA